jgi:hypothetical protein
MAKWRLTEKDENPTQSDGVARRFFSEGFAQGKPLFFLGRL